MVFSCCKKKRKLFRNSTKSNKTRVNVQANSFKKTIIKSTIPAKSGGGFASGSRQAQPTKGQRVNFLKKPSSVKSATVKASATKGKFKVKDSKATKKQDSSIKKSSSASSRSKKTSTSKQTSATAKPPASIKTSALPKKTPEEKVKVGKSLQQSERKKEKTKEGIPPPGSTVDSPLLPFVDKIKSTERVDVSTKADPSPHQAPPFVYASIADPRHPQQQLIVSSFVAGGRRVKRWTYADSYSIDQMPPLSLGAMLAARPVCSREDCGLTVVEPVGMMQNKVPSVFSKNRQKVRKDGEQIEKKDEEEMIDSAKKNPISDGSACVPQRHSELFCGTSLTFSRTENVRTSSMTNVSEKGVAERHLSEEAVRKKLLESAQLLQQAISKMNEVRYRENDDSLYAISLYKVQKYKKKVDRIARGLSAVGLHESKTNQQKKGELGY